MIWLAILRALKLAHFQLAIILLICIHHYGVRHFLSDFLVPFALLLSAC
jgi:hypothetical protein